MLLRDANPKNLSSNLSVTDCYWLLLLGQKSNLSVRFKFEPITTNHL